MSVFGVCNGVCVGADADWAAGAGVGEGVVACVGTICV